MVKNRGAAWALGTLILIVAIAALFFRYTSRPDQPSYSQRQDRSAPIQDDLAFFHGVGDWAQTNHDAIEALSALTTAIFSIGLFGSTTLLWSSTRKLWRMTKAQVTIAERSLTELEAPSIFIKITEPGIHLRLMKGPMGNWMFGDLKYNFVNAGYDS